jgi:ferric-dicitrate binding protein FerR (iron transport regulator)
MDFLVKAAAVLFIPLLVLYVSRDNIRKNNTVSEVTYSEIYSPMGSRTMFYLPDGSKGWLNGGSYLKYAEGFPGKTRDVILRGEAFFDVKTNPKKPFIVTGKNLDIVATGTSFNVLAREDEAETEIVLVEGKLDIYRNTFKGQELITSSVPGELLHYLPQQTGSFIQKVDVDKYVSWTKGKLVFREDPFADVVKKINRWYNVNILIKDKILESYKYVATFQDETLDEVLKMLAVSAPISYRNLPRKQLADGTFEKRIIELYYKPHKIKKANPMSN